MLILLQCKNNAHCSGIGDRVKGLQTAFWMVRPRRRLPASRAQLGTPPAAHSAADVVLAIMTQRHRLQCGLRT